MEKKIQKKRKYIKEIDGLRALAVIMVLAYHLKMPFAKSGLLGVTVFFVISGYLITGILINEIEESGGVDLVVCGESEDCCRQYSPWQL